MEYANDLLQRLFAAGLELQLALGLIGLGLVLKHVTRVPNGLIPAVMLLGGCAGYVLMGNPGAAPASMRNPEVWLGLIGLIIGAGAWFAHDKLLRHVEDWIQRRFGGPAPPQNPS